MASIKVDPELWRRAKLLAVCRGIRLKVMIESLLRAEVEADLSGGDVLQVSGEHLKILMERRMEGKTPLVILSDKERR